MQYRKSKEDGRCLDQCPHNKFKKVMIGSVACQKCPQNEGTDIEKQTVRCKLS